MSINYGENMLQVLDIVSIEGPCLRLPIRYSLRITTLLRLVKFYCAHRDDLVDAWQRQCEHVSQHGSVAALPEGKMWHRTSCLSEDILNSLQRQGDAS